MKAILQYVQKIITLGKDGTIYLRIDTGEMATVTILNKSIVAASLDNTLGKEALEVIKLAVITHMEFWDGITQKQDIQRMILVQTETDKIAQMPKDEMRPYGAALSSKPIDLKSTKWEVNDAEDSLDSSSIGTRNSSSLETSDRDIKALINLMTEYIGPAAECLTEDIVEQATDTDELIRLLSKELFDDQEREDFEQKAYFVLGL